MTGSGFLGDWWEVPFEACPTLRCRLQPLEPCSDPACPCGHGANTAVLMTEIEEEAWIVTAVASNPAEVIAAMEADEDVENLVRTSILYGVAWPAMEHDILRVRSVQEKAVTHTPGRYFKLDPQLCKNMRAAIHEANPLAICALVNMTDKWAFDPGGTTG